jgi:hypothetical protein
MLTRKDYKAIAQIISNVGTLSVLGLLNKWDLVEQLEVYMLQDNPNFDKIKFEKACE